MTDHPMTDQPQGDQPQGDQPQGDHPMTDQPRSDALKIYVGYDSREDIAWQVCRHSLLRHAAAPRGAPGGAPGGASGGASGGVPLEVHPLRQASLRELGLYTRGADAATTEFSLTRFLVPYLAAHPGWTIFVDCDFVFTRDVREVLAHADPACAVHVVQHDYRPAQSVKMDGKAQSSYPRKNWSSFILFNGAHPDVQALTPAVVNTAPPAHLHRFAWVQDEAAIGALPLEWNFLEGEYPPPPTPPAAIHYTNGGPWFDNWQNVDFAEVWRQERDLWTATQASQMAG